MSTGPEPRAGKAPFDFEQTFRAQYERIARVIAGVVHDSARAEELAVEIFLKFWRNPKAHGENANGWLYRAAVRKALDELRRRNRRARYESLFRFRSPVPTPEEQFKIEADFFDQTLRRVPPAKMDSFIRYYTMGEAKWHTTNAWPPKGSVNERLFFARRNTLTPSAPTASEPQGADTYIVDFTASSGTQTRWHTQLGGGDVVYPDRAPEDLKLLTYTTAPLAADLEITGSPVLSLEMSSTTSDGAIHAYLEDVAPTGRVTYLDEGIFRIIHRKEVHDLTSLPYQPLGPAHSFLRLDAAPMKPGEVATVRFSLFPTSVVVRKGHSIRIALGGADASLFQRYPATGMPTWTIYRETGLFSFLDLPTMNH